MGSSFGTPQPMNTKHLYDAYNKYLPQTLSATTGQIVPTAQAQLQAAQATEPGYQQLNLDQTAQYAPALAQIGSDIQRQQALSGAQTNLQQLMGPGGQSAVAADIVARAANPNYYKVQDASSEQAKNLINSINLNGLSPGEANSIERSNNQNLTSTGNLGINNPNNVITNALNFGGAYNQKLEILQNALQTGNSVAASAQNTGFNPVNVALGQPQTSTNTPSTFAPVSNTAQSGAAQNTFGFGSGLMNNQFGMQDASIAAAASRANANSVPSYLGSLPT